MERVDASLQRPLRTVWTLGWTDDPQVEPAEFVPAEVPGSVQTSWAKAKGWPDVMSAGNPQDYRWMEDKWWVYRARLEEQPTEPTQTRFRLGRVDHQALVRSPGARDVKVCGFRTQETAEHCVGYQVGDVVEVVLEPVPKAHPFPEDRTQAVETTKPAVSYKWDFHPRLVPLGIIEPSGFVHEPRLLEPFEVRVRHQGDVRWEVCVHGGPEKPAKAVLRGPDGQLLAEEPVTAGAAKFEVRDPELWWPRGYGKQTLYSVSVVALDPNTQQPLGEISRRFGFRTSKLVMAEGTWHDPEVERPVKGPNKAPICLEVNGQRLFAKGGNWVSPHIFPGHLSDELLDRQVELAFEAGFNILRCWGGAPMMPERFFDRCDELGIMVWQEYPLSCNCYSESKQYLNELDSQAFGMTRRGSFHPCIVIWCGGNELFNNWSGMTEQHLAIRLLNDVTDRAAPGIPFLPTSPVHGMGHGPYSFRLRDGSEPYQVFPSSRCTAYTEYGVSGPAPVERLRELIPEEDLWPPRKGTQWQTRHALSEWGHTGGGWLFLDAAEHYFGPMETLEAAVEHLHWLQAEGLRFIYEEARRQKPFCSMAINWCFNEPWPCAANGSLVHWPHHPKPALRAVAQACRPVLSSAQVRKFCWKPGELFEADLWLLNDSLDQLAAGELRATITVDGIPSGSLTWPFEAVPGSQNLRGPTMRCRLPEDAEGELLLSVEVEGHPEWNSTYRLWVKRV